MALRRTFSGGVHPDDGKGATAQLAIVNIDTPAKVVVPLRQHLGAPATPVVKVGDWVVKGQVVGDAAGWVSAPVHASISGEVTAIAKHRHPGGYMAESVFIEARDEAPAPADGQEAIAWPPDPILLRGATTDYESLAPATIKSMIREAGIVGMGGAAFPTHVKLSPPQDKPVDTLVINGAECEPYLTCDHRTMLEDTDRIVHGVRILMRALGVNRALIGIEDNKPDAIAKLEEAVADINGIEVVVCKVKYPQGGEKQLIKALTGREVPPPPGLPLDVGVVVQNVGTAALVAGAIMEGRSFTDRVITVSGPLINKPANIRVPIGTMLTDVIKACTGLKDDPGRVIQGGPMMGIALADLEVPVVKGTSGFLFFERGDDDQYEASACIRCGKCVDVCPLKLEPVEMARCIEAGDLDGAVELGVMECMECGSCSFICPANRWLVQLVRIAKARINERKRKS